MSDFYKELFRKISDEYRDRGMPGLVRYKSELEGKETLRFYDVLFDIVCKANSNGSTQRIIGGIPAKFYRRTVRELRKKSLQDLCT